VLGGNGRFISSRAPVNLTSVEILLQIITMCLDVLIGGREKLREKLEITSSTLNPLPIKHTLARHLLAQQLVYYVKSVFCSVLLSNMSLVMF